MQNTERKPRCLMLKQGLRHTAIAGVQQATKRNTVISITCMHQSTIVDGFQIAHILDVHKSSTFQDLPAVMMRSPVHAVNGCALIVVRTLLEVGFALHRELH